MRDTIDWYLQHPAWWQAVRADEGFRGYIDRQYGWRLAAATTEEQE